MEQVHHVDGTTWSSTGRHVHRDEVRFTSFPRAWPRDLLEGTRLGRRVTRGDKCLVRPTPFGVLGIRAGWAYRLSAGGAEPLWPYRHDAPLRGKLAVTDAALWLGEYWSNVAREPVVLWRIDADLRRTPAATFEGIRHLHGVFVDPHDGALWAPSGDLDGECWLFRSTDGFRTVDRLGDGTQHSRAAHLFFTDQHVAWCTDSETHPNHAVRLDRRTGALEVGMPLPGPVLYGTSTTDGWHLAGTGVERGAGVLRQDAVVYRSQDAWTWSEHCAFPKDWLRPHRVFKHGLLWFPTGRYRLDELWVSGEALRGLDGRASRLPG